MDTMPEPQMFGSIILVRYDSIHRSTGVAIRCRKRAFASSTDRSLLLQRPRSDVQVLSTSFVLDHMIIAGPMIHHVRPN